jgi:CRISPR-associated protein Csm3
MKYLESIKIESKIVVKNGLHIGAGKEALEIGGLDGAVIKDPFTNLPYIPGSSLKGKMRFLTEWNEAGAVINSKPHECEDPFCKICRVFGTTRKAEGGIRGITRLIVRDAKVSLKEGEVFDPTTKLEIKYCNTINRMTGTSDKGLRNIERVVPGVIFASEIIYRVFDLDDSGKADYDNFNTVVKALQLVENDTLGGSGSRGCGQVTFKGITVTGGKIPGPYKDLDELLEQFNRS